MKPYQRNPRTITKKRLKRLEETLQRLGDLGGIVHNLETDEIIGGNQRMAVFRGGTVEIIETYDKPDDQGTVAHGFVIWKDKKYGYRQVRWDEATSAEANLAANVNAGAWNWDELANWDPAILIGAGFDEEFEKSLRNDTSALAQLLLNEKEPIFGEYDESIADNVDVCLCPTCGFQHAKKNATQ